MSVESSRNIHISDMFNAKGQMNHDNNIEVQCSCPCPRLFCYPLDAFLLGAIASVKVVLGSVDMQNPLPPEIICAPVGNLPMPFVHSMDSQLGICEDKLLLQRKDCGLMNSLSYEKRRNIVARVDDVFHLCS